MLKTFTVADMMPVIAEALNDAGPDADFYSVVASTIIERYADIDPKELGYKAPGEYGMCGGTVPGERAMGVEAAVAKFVKLARDMDWDAAKREDIDITLVPLAYRLNRMGFKLGASSWHNGEGKALAVRQEYSNSSVMDGFTDPNDERVQYAIKQVERVAHIGQLNMSAFDVITSLALGSYDAGNREREPWTFPTHVAKKV